MPLRGFGHVLHVLVDIPSSALQDVNSDNTLAEAAKLGAVKEDVKETSHSPASVRKDNGKLSCQKGPSMKDGHMLQVLRQKR